MGRRARPGALPPPGGGGDRALRRAQRRARDADRVGEVDGRRRGALRRARGWEAHVLHGADQGAGVREVLRPVSHLRRDQRRDGHRRRRGQRRRADHLLHRRGAGEHRAARWRGVRCRAGRDGRVSLLRRRPARLGVAGPAALPSQRAVPADVGHARRRLQDHRGPHPPHRPRDRVGERCRASGPAQLRLVAGAAARAAGTARGRGPGARLRRALHPGLGDRARQRAALGQALHARGARCDRRGDRRLPLHRRVRPDAVAAGAQRDRRPPRGDAAALPALGRAARADRQAEGDLRDRHARCRHQRPDPHGRVHRAGEVRRHPPPAAQGARVSPDRRPRGPRRLRHRRHRDRAGARARDRACPGGGQGGREGQEAAAQEGARGRGQLD